MDPQWQTITEPIPGYEAWTVEVRLAGMPDGTIATIGLRIEPREDYEGKIRDQRVTSARLTRFPIGYATAAAKAQWAASAFESATTPTAEYQAVTDLLIAHLEAQTAALNEETKLLREVLEAKDQARRQQRIAEIGERGELLERTAGFYRVLKLRPTTDKPLRLELAELLDVHPGTVDRYLREARMEGFLEPYDGKQGKHGKTDTEVPAAKKAARKRGQQ